MKNEISPALRSHLKRLSLSADELGRLEATYKLVVEHGAGEHAIVRREEGVSFNPYPARVAQLLILEGEIRSVDRLVRTMLACVPLSKLSSQLAPMAQAAPAVRIAALIENALRGEVGALEPEFAVHLIDLSRHLHLSSLSIEERQRFFSGCRKALATVNSPDSRLITVLSHAVARYGAIAEGSPPQ